MHHMYIDGDGDNPASTHVYSITIGYLHFKVSLALEEECKPAVDLEALAAEGGTR